MCRAVLHPHQEGRVKEIPLSQRQVAFVDDEDFEWLAEYTWSARWRKSGRTFYAMRNALSSEEGGTISMHVELMKPPLGMMVDHCDRNGLNNQRINLRLANPSQNAWNQRPKRGFSSQYKGVWWDKERKLWMVQIRIDGTKRTLGRFETEEEAARAYDRVALETRGTFAYLNFPTDGAND